MNEEPKYATITISMDRPRMTISLPYSQGTEELKFRDRFRDFIKNEGRNVSISKKHREWVLETLRCLYDGVWEYREYSATGICDTRCQEAQEDECVCSCKGEFHQGGGDWKYTIGTVLIADKSRALVTRWYESYDHTSYMTVLPYGHPVRRMQPLLPASEEPYV